MNILVVFWLVFCWGYQIDEDPLSADTDNINNWDFDEDGDKADADGNKLLFAD